ncbi:MAG: phosphopentomutase [Pseudomonadota bacterium]
MGRTETAFPATTNTKTPATVEQESLDGRKSLRAPSLFKRVVLLILDSVGCGGAPDAAAYGDAGADTLGNIARAVGGLSLPNLQRFGLGNAARVDGVPPSPEPAGAVGRMREASVGKDTTTGHWELAGLRIADSFATFPAGFPTTIIDELASRVGRGVIGNKAASGTEILRELGSEHLRTGKLIVYTSIDSVFQIAAHEDVVPLDELYDICRTAREILDPWRVGRVIARPFVGEDGSSFRRTYHRRDLSMPPPAPTVLDCIAASGIPVVGVGKIGDIYAGHGITEEIHTEGNRDGMERTIGVLERVPAGLIVANLVDFDTLYGHRNDFLGYARCLAELDSLLPALEEKLTPDDMLVITADHGNDPTTPGTDHTREEVPLLVCGPSVVPGVQLGTRATFADVGATLAEVFAVSSPSCGTSFLEEVTR